jgi:ABC-type branched-subunit amino acid transport system permease subunit
MKERLLGVALAAAAAVFLVLLLRAESEKSIAALIAVAVAAALAAVRLRLTARFPPALAIVAVAAVSLALHEDDFSLLLLARALIVVLACLGLNIQFGYAGVVNFAGATFFGVGGYTAAVLARGTGIPHLIVLFLGGAAAAIAGTILVVPVLRTRGHYAALVTIAFALLFRTFFEVNDSLGGPQGLKLPEMRIGPLHFNDPIELGSFFGSFYLKYIALSLLFAALGFALVLRLERSFIGVLLDCIRLDETAAASFGIDIARGKITAFTLGNFLTGVAGALSAFMVGFIAPNNYSFGESLILVSILLLGGVGSPWGLPLASAIVLLLPEKLQVIQEYRFLLFAAMVILILLFRPSGLVPRPLRKLA